MRCEARQMSGPVPSPSMKGRIGVAGTCRRPSAMRIASPSRGGFSVSRVNMGLLRLAKNGAIRQNTTPPKAFHRAERRSPPPARSGGHHGPEAGAVHQRRGQRPPSFRPVALLSSPILIACAFSWATRSGSGPSPSAPGRNESSLRHPNGGLMASSRAARTYSPHLTPLYDNLHWVFEWAFSAAVRVGSSEWLGGGSTETNYLRRVLRCSSQTSGLRHVRTPACDGLRLSELRIPGAALASRSPPRDRSGTPPQGQRRTHLPHHACANEAHPE